MLRHTCITNQKIVVCVFGKIKQLLVLLLKLVHYQGHQVEGKVGTTRKSRCHHQSHFVILNFQQNATNYYLSKNVTISRILLS